MAEPSMEERRRFVRLDTRLPVGFQVQTAAGQKETVTKDISAGGICLFVDEPVALGTQLEMTIKVPGRDRPVSFTGEVVWCEEYELIGQTQRDRSIELGIKFVKIDPQDQQAIMRYVILGLQPPRPA